jgi:cell wall-associated NlpC family hydrolase
VLEAIKHLVMIGRWISLLLVLWGVPGCDPMQEERPVGSANTAGVRSDSIGGNKDTIIAKYPDTTTLMINPLHINTGRIGPAEVLDFARSLIGIPYKYGSTDPAQGFDCSGFITHVFSHFKIKVPRSSIDFTNVGRTVPLDSARAGDLVLFTGTDSTERHVGHMGIVTSNKGGQVEFIHSTSGKSYGVTISPLSRYYLGRYVRTARIFVQNDQ